MFFGQSHPAAEAHVNAKSRSNLTLLNRFAFILFSYDVFTVREQNQLPAIAAWCDWESGEDWFFGVVWVVMAVLMVVMMIADAGMVGG